MDTNKTPNYIEYDFQNHQDKAVFALYYNEALDNVHRIWVQMTRIIFEKEFVISGTLELKHFQKSDIIIELLSDKHELVKRQIIERLDYYLPWATLKISDNDTPLIAYRLLTYMSKLFELRNFYSHSLKDLVYYSPFTYGQSVYDKSKDPNQLFTLIKSLKNYRIKQYIKHVFPKIKCTDNWLKVEEFEILNFNKDIADIFKSAKREVERRFDIDFNTIKKYGILESGKEKETIEGKKINENANQLSKQGMVFFLSLFLDKERINGLLSRVKGFKGTHESHFLNHRRCYLVFNARLPRPQLKSTTPETSLAMSILNELRKVPKPLYELMTAEAKNKYKMLADGKSAFEHGDIKDLENYDENEVLMVRPQNRFADYAIQLLEFSGKLEGIQIALHLGKAFVKPAYEKVIAEERVDRELLRPITSQNHFETILANPPYQDWVKQSELDEIEYTKFEYPLKYYRPKYAWNNHSHFKSLGITLSDEGQAPNLSISDKNEPSFNNTRPEFITDKENIKYLCYLLSERAYKESCNEHVKNLLIQWKEQFHGLIDKLADGTYHPDMPKDENGKLELGIPFSYIPTRIKKYLLQNSNSMDSSKSLLLDKLEVLTKQTDDLLEDNEIIEKEDIKGKDKNKEREEANIAFREDIEKQRQRPNNLRRGEKAQWLADDIQYWMRPKAKASDTEITNQNFKKLNSDEFDILQENLALFTNYERLQWLFKELGLYDDKFGHPFLKQVQAKKANKKTRIEHLFYPYLQARKVYIESKKQKAKQLPQISNDQWHEHFYFIKNKSLRRMYRFEGETDKEFQDYLYNLKQEPIIIHPKQWKDWCRDVHKKPSATFYQLLQESNKMDTNTQTSIYSSEKYSTDITAWPDEGFKSKNRADKEEEVKAEKKALKEKRNQFWLYHQHLAEDQILWNLIPDALQDPALQNALKKEQMDKLESNVLDISVEIEEKISGLSLPIKLECKIKDTGKIRSMVTNRQLFDGGENGLLRYLKNTNDENKPIPIDFDKLRLDLQKWYREELPQLMDMFLILEEIYQVDNPIAYQQHIESNPKGPFYNFREMIAKMALPEELVKIRNTLMHGSVPMLDSKTYQVEFDENWRSTIFTIITSKIRILVGEDYWNRIEKIAAERQK